MSFEGKTGTSRTHTTVGVVVRVLPDPESRVRPWQDRWLEHTVEGYEYPVPPGVRGTNLPTSVRVGGSGSFGVDGWDSPVGTMSEQLLQVRLRHHGERLL